MAIDATVGGATANCYISLADAETYFSDERLPVTAWSGETDARKANALIMATRRIDQESFEGTKVASGQALKFPRYFAFDDDNEELPTDSIWVPLEHATCEEALVFLIADDGGDVPLTDTGLEQFDEATIGPMNMVRDQSFKAGQLSANAARLLGVVLESSGSGKLQRFGTAY